MVDVGEHTLRAIRHARHGTLVVEPPAEVVRRGALRYGSEVSLFIPNLRGERYRFQLPTRPKLAYGSLRRRENNGEDNYWNFVTPDDHYVCDVLFTVARDQLGSRWRQEKRDLAKLVVDLVHCIPYHTRKLSYVKFPLETLEEGQGNCADLAVLGASWLQRAGIPCGFAVFPKHIGLGIASGRRGAYIDSGGARYFLTEMTGTDWPDEPIRDKIGEWDEKKYPLRQAAMQLPRPSRLRFSVR